MDHVNWTILDDIYYLPAVEGISEEDTAGLNPTWLFGGSNFDDEKDDKRIEDGHIYPDGSGGPNYDYGNHDEGSKGGTNTPKKIKHPNLDSEPDDLPDDIEDVDNTNEDEIHTKF